MAIRTATWWTWDSERDAMRRVTKEVSYVADCNAHGRECVRLGSVCYPVSHFEFVS